MIVSFYLKMRTCPVTLTVWVFSQTVGNYKPSEASSCHNIVIRAIYVGWVSKNDST